MAFAATGGDDSMSTQDEVLPQLSKEEFDRMKAELQGQNEELDRGPKGTRMFWGKIRALIADHDMNLYLGKIRNFLKDTDSK